MPSHAPKPQAPTPHALKRSALLALCACVLVAQSMVAAINLLIPQLSSSSLHPSHTEILWTVDAYVIVFASLLIPAGALADLPHARLRSRGRGPPSAAKAPSSPASPCSRQAPPPSRSHRLRLR